MTIVILEIAIVISEIIAITLIPLTSVHSKQPSHIDPLEFRNPQPPVFNPGNIKNARRLARMKVKIGLRHDYTHTHPLSSIGRLMNTVTILRVSPR